MKHLVTLLIFAGAVAAYMLGSMPGATALLIVGVVMELLGWYRIFRGEKHSSVPTH
jgi:hypothetical protein